MPAIICPKCGYQNVYGALFCASCFSLLTDTVPIDRRTSALSHEQAAAFANSQAQRSRHAINLGTHAMALYIEQHDEPLIVLMATQAVIGRTVPGSSSETRIDLTPYAAQDNGISREHGVFKRTERGVTFEDMNSSNGSWINDLLLQPYKPSLIKSGDRLRLGKLMIEVQLSET